MTQPPPLPPPTRPIFVSIISYFYLAAFILTGVSLWLTYSGLIPLSQAQRTYLDSVTWVDHVFTFGLMAAKLAGATALFFLRRSAPYLFAFGLLVSICDMIYQLVARNLLQTMGPLPVAGAVVGWGLSTAIIIYAGILARKGVLR